MTTQIEGKDGKSTMGQVAAQVQKAFQRIGPVGAVAMDQDDRPLQGQGTAGQNARDKPAS